jgi:hypothetical protein
VSCSAMRTRPLLLRSSTTYLGLRATFAAQTRLRQTLDSAAAVANVLDIELQSISEKRHYRSIQISDTKSVGVGGERPPARRGGEAAWRLSANRVGARQMRSQAEPPGAWPRRPK